MLDLGGGVGVPSKGSGTGAGGKEGEAADCSPALRILAVHPHSDLEQGIISLIEHSMQKLRFYCKINEYQLSSKNKLGFVERILNINTVNEAKVLASSSARKRFLSFNFFKEKLFSLYH